MNYEIPKEIKSKPRMVGLEMKELVILLTGFFLVFTMLKDMVHSVFIIPFYIVSIGLLLWLVMPSKNNPAMKNHKSIVLLLKRDKQVYHAMDHQNIINKKFEDVSGEKGVK